MEADDAGDVTVRVPYFSFIVSLYVSDLPNVTIEYRTADERYRTVDTTVDTNSRYC